MADYAIVGRKGNGKTLTSIGIIKDALIANKRVVTNLNINLDKLMPRNSLKTVIRIPDHPSINDLNAIGRGQEGVIEEDNGIIVLDECSHFFNSRDFGDKSRKDVLDWLTQSRKLGWDVYYIMQGLSQIDKQIRETQIEYTISIKRTDKWPVPFIGFMSAMIFGEKYRIKWPKGQLAVTRQGVAADSIRLSTRWYRSHEFYEAYETQQLFRPRAESNEWNFIGLHTQLSAWHIKGRYMPPVINWREFPVLALKAIIYFAFVITKSPLPHSGYRGAALM